MDPETAYWKRYRAYARQKAGAQMALILLPVLLVVGFGWALSTSGYTAGDPRGDIVWRLSVMVAFDLVYLAMPPTATTPVRTRRERRTAAEGPHEPPDRSR